MRTPEGVRLDVRVADRLVTLLHDREDAFWARFYAVVPRERLHLGERRIEPELWRLSADALAAVLRPFWTARFGSPGAGSAPPPAPG